jgi:hypothetical protein
MNGNLDNIGLEKMMDDLAGQAYDSGQEEERKKRIGDYKDSRDIPVKARAKQKHIAGNNRHEEDNRRLDGAANIIEEASKAIMQKHLIVARCGRIR